MANWKKMAEAFGRALADPGTSREGRRLIKAGKRELTDARLKPAGNGLRVEPSNPRYDKDVADAYTRGQLGGIQDDMENIQKGYDREERGKLFDDRTEQRTDEALETHRDKEWDDAFKSAKEHAKRGYGDSYPEDMASEGADAFEKQLWDVIDGLKAQGRSVEDILGALKSMGQK